MADGGVPESEAAERMGAERRKARARVGGTNGKESAPRLRRGPATWPLHPFLFAAASVVALHASNLRETSFDAVMPVLGATVGAAVVLFLSVGALLRDFGPRVAVFTSVVLVAALYHEALFGRLNWVLDGALPAGAALPLTLLVAGAMAVATLSARFDLTLANALLNGIAIVVFATPAWTAASYALETRSLRQPPPAEATSAAYPAEPVGGAIAAPSAESTPDIYYFIFDRYASEQTLARVYGFDNRPFAEFLRASGFYVALESHANYPKTAQSLASTFHMDYLDFLVDQPLAKRNEWHPIYDMLEHHRVGSILKSRGYRLVQIGSWWAPTQSSAATDESRSFGLSEFAWLYLQRTILPKVLEAALPVTGIARMMAWDNGQCRRVPLQFEAVKTVAGRPEPTFTFVHVLLPHDPYVFDADGNCLSAAEVQSRGEERGYLGQLQYTNALIRDVVGSLLAQPDRPIIILQADEGPYPEAYRIGNRSWTIATPEELATKSGILNAYYFPDGDYSALYQDITPVNTFRLVFDKYFGTGFGPLPDRIFAFPDYSSIYDFFDVTGDIRQGDHPKGED
jgi:hypothetical protein